MVRTKRVIELAAEESRRTGHEYVGTEQLLVGLLFEGKGIGARLLRDHGGTLESVRGAIRGFERG